MAGGYSKHNKSPQVIKRQGRHLLLRPMAHIIGPRVDGYTIIVPHAGDSPELEAALEAKGFERNGFQWKRKVDTPLNGRVYDSIKWLIWARLHYRAAWEWFRR